MDSISKDYHIGIPWNHSYDLWRWRTWAFDLKWPWRNSKDIRSFFLWFHFTWGNVNRNLETLSRSNRRRKLIRARGILLSPSPPLSLYLSLSLSLILSEKIKTVLSYAASLQRPFSFKWISRERAMPFAYNGTLMERKKNKDFERSFTWWFWHQRRPYVELKRIISGNKKEKNEHGVLSKFRPMHSLSEIIYEDSRYRMTDWLAG